MKKKFLFGALILTLLAFLTGCGEQSDAQGDLAPVTPIEESYEYTAKSQVYTRPAMTSTDRRLDSLTLTLEDGFYFCITTDTEKATEFINAQRTLLQFLADSSVETRKLRYYAVDYDDSFSDSESNKAYIALSHVKSYRQVLVTLQTLWGDYTDYGYIYHAANAIAAHLGWQTATVEAVEQSTLDTFFVENPDALNLVYPCFTTTYADEETVQNCYALSSQLFEKIDLREALTKPIDEQVNDFRALVDAYAQELSVTFERQKNGYAYYGEYLPLKIMTTYAKLVVEHDFVDADRANREKFGEQPVDYFSDYQSIFETANKINEEISSAVAYFGLEEQAGVITINWNNEESAIEKCGKTVFNRYSSTSHEVDSTLISLYMHGYYRHLASLLNPDHGYTWQLMAFCEMGRARSQYAQRSMELLFTMSEKYVELFYNCTGRTYQSGLDDYLEIYDIFCYVFDDYTFDAYYGRNGLNSFCRYLTNLYGEDTVYQLLLFPETIESVTGKTWEAQEADWLAYMAEKFEGVEIPDWVAEDQE